jgi:hypothetical protein
MSHRVFAWDANPMVDSRLYRISNKQAAEQVAAGKADYIELADGRRAIQLRQTKEERASNSIGHGNLVPFGRTYNPLMQPPKLHYEIPQAGECRTVCLRRFKLRKVIVDGKHMLVRRTIKVSARKIDLTAAAYLTPARTLSSPNVLSSSLDSHSSQLAAQPA